MHWWVTAAEAEFVVTVAVSRSHLLEHMPQDCNLAVKELVVLEAHRSHLRSENPSGWHNQEQKTRRDLHSLSMSVDTDLSVEWGSLGQP